MKTSHRRSVRRLVLATAAVTAATVLLAACGGSDDSGGSAQPQGSPDAVNAALEKGGTITYWSWTPSAEAQVAAFQKEYPNVKVNLVNAGTGNDHYTKLQNAIKAGSGAPDVAQIEYQALPQFALPGSLVDLREYGFNTYESAYTASTWTAVHAGDGLYGLPQDSGPMALFYNKEVFDKYGITVPKTWDEYVAAGKKLHAADPKKYITNDSGDAGFTTSMIWQAGGKPFSTDGKNVSINLQDDGTKKWTGVWDQLVTGGLVGNIPGWTDEWFKALGDGTIASLPTGAWMPGVMEASVKAGAGKWRVAPMPTYDGQPATAENGGSTQSVLKQSANPALAAAFVKWLNHDGGVKPFLASGGFPSTTADLKDATFVDKPSAYFGGQQINQVLTGSADSVVKGWSYLPFQLYANTIFGDTVGKSYQAKSELNTGLKAWQDALVTYGNQQGFQTNG
ncbi:multiple sugar transport system substrate-binding protein [Kribbella sp. VKM Ac-2527]|uniref:Multiple sugar transport system substrate-binding protein n=1 Tax=Kribbella caucasensis TaxID=2512215 RepID=A0A4R6KAT0_9ACTN|nr:sugar ABC transporter substrate-binding protein [Kribbella sp. VKM Ac-2527]TDO47175.1 multiple sugar transport system substrate-binding protein [Kribbella sp. VKM Ac-2527]